MRWTKHMRWWAAAMAQHGMGTLPGHADNVDWDFYASVRVNSFWEWRKAAEGTTFADGRDKEFGYSMDLQPNSRVGARVKMSDEFSAWAEAGFSESGVTVRHLIGHWHFGEGTLSIGQTQTPISRLDSRRVRTNDLGLTAFGEPYMGRRPLVQMSLYGATFGMVKPHAITNLLDPTQEYSKTDHVMPRLELSWRKPLGPIAVDAFGGYHTYRISAEEYRFSIHAYMAGAGLWLKQGNAEMRMLGYYARNARQLGQYFSPQPASFGSARFTDEGQLVNNNVLAGAAFSRYRFNERMRGEIGYGYVQSADDRSGARADRWHCYYVQAPVVIAGGLSITPEIGVMEDTRTNRRIAYAGAKWQADF